MMASKGNKKPKTAKPKPRKRDNTDLIIGLLLLLLAVFITISLLSFKAQDSLLNLKTPANWKLVKNWGGALGFVAAQWLYEWLGVVAYLVPFLLLLWGINRLLRRPATKLFLTSLVLAGFGFFLEITLGYFHNVALFVLHKPKGVRLEVSLGGRIGTASFDYLASLVGRLGLGFILGFLLLLSAVLIFNLNLHRLVSRLFERTKTAAKQRREKQALAGEPGSSEAEETPAEAPAAQEPQVQEETAEPGQGGRVVQRIVYTPVMDVPQEELALAELLDPVSEELTRPPDRETREGAKLLDSKLEEFGVTGTVGDILPGPVITRYEFPPAPGIKISKIMNLADDLSLSLKAERIRLLPIPGKSAVGIEIPNRTRKTVPLRLIVGSQDFVDSSSPLTIALGTTITGTPQVADLASIPHLLIAGTTGSGKSVCIHSILASILIKAGPSQVRFMTIDPKRLELPSYNPIPHLLQPTIVDPRKAAQSLELVVRIMEERYKEFSRVGVRDIAGYNRETKNPKPYIVVIVDELADLMLTAPSEIEQRIIRLAQMARAVGIHLVLATQRPSVDVITGLIKANFPGRIAFQVASKTDSRTILDMNGAEALLGQGDMLFLPPGKGEPVRLHGSFVSTGEAKRIVEKLARSRLKALLVNAQVSEEKAAEFTEAVISADLLDPLLDPHEPLYETKRRRLSEIISPQTLEAIEGRYYPTLEELAPIREQMEHRPALEETDEFFAEAARLVMQHKEASVSMLQRRLNVGWARAGRIIDQLEQAGIVGPYEGSKSRKVLVQTEEELAKLLKGLGRG